MYLQSAYKWRINESETFWGHYYIASYLFKLSRFKQECLFRLIKIWQIIINNIDHIEQ